MGTLDDAIREHLELKRRLGASDEELEQKESEAFGKGRQPAPPPPAEPAPDAAEPEEAAAPQDEPPAEQPEPFVHDELAAAEPAANGRSAEPGIETAEWEPEPAGSSLDEEEFEPDEVPPEESLDPMTVRDQRSRPEPADGAPSEDVLEETPEFLEETPESDRLWFEQRPPKDFDFD
jgi:hypothetical protein